jgi:dihydroxyacetone kinase
LTLLLFILSFTYAPINAAVLARLRAGAISGEDVVGSLIAVSEVAAEKMGGTSGALYS